jgi:RND family efflux transporter MFP subunit
MSMRPSLFALFMATLPLAACSNGPGSDTAAGTVSALVTAQPPHQGSLPHIVTAYGTAVPALDATSVLSIRAEGHVTHLDVIAGAAIARGQRLLSFALAPSAVATYRQAATAVDVASSQRVHTAQLLAGQLATRDQLAQADKALSDARTALDALRKQQGDGATIELRAPFDGVVGTITAAQGDALPAGAPLLSVTRRDGVVVSVGIEPGTAPPVEPGDPVTLVPLGAGGAVAGEVVRVTHAMDPRTHLLGADIRPQGEVLVGMGYRAEVVVAQAKGWLLPRDAVIGDGQHWHVFQLAGGKAVQVPVTLVGESHDVTAVAGAIDPQRPIVTVGGTQLDDGMAVRTGNAESEQ